MPHSVIDLRVGGSHSAAYRHVYTFRFSCSSISFRFQLNCFLFFLLCLVSWFFFSFSLLRVHSVCTHFLILHSFRPFQSSFWTSSPSGFPLCVWTKEKKKPMTKTMFSLLCIYPWIFGHRIYRILFLLLWYIRTDGVCSFLLFNGCQWMPNWDLLLFLFFFNTIEL